MVINYSCTEREKQLYPGCTESRHRQFLFRCSFQGLAVGVVLPSLLTREAA